MLIVCLAVSESQVMTGGLRGYRQSGSDRLAGGPF
jgi:hypothetical protein